MVFIYVYIAPGEILYDFNGYKIKKTYPYHLSYISLGKTIAYNLVFCIYTSRKKSLYT